MTGRRNLRRLVASVTCAALVATGCSFGGVNSLPLPGAQGRGANATTYRVEVANVGTLEANSPVMTGDVIVGSISRITVQNWHAVVEVSVKPDVVIPANAVAKVGQTSLLGSMHLALDPPVGEPPRGELAPGTTLGLNETSTYPSTEQTLASLSAVVNGGGLGQIGDIIHNFSAALDGHEQDAREALTRLNDIVVLLDDQRDDIISSIEEADRFAGTLATQRDALDRVVRQLPPALDVLIRERPNLTTALDELRTFSNMGTRLIDDSRADLVRNLENLQPAIKALADVGPDINAALAMLPTFPYNQGFIDRGVRGDYLNLDIIIDLTVPRLRRTLFLGTRWGQPGATLTPAPGEPFYLNYSYDPMAAGLVQPPTGAPPPPAAPVEQSALPVAPPWGAAAVSGPAAPIFAGPYPAELPPPPPPPTAPPGGG